MLNQLKFLLVEVKMGRLNKAVTEQQLISISVE